MMQHMNEKIELRNVNVELVGEKTEGSFLCLDMSIKQVNGLSH